MVVVVVFMMIMMVMFMGKDIFQFYIYKLPIDRLSGCYVSNINININMT